MIVIFVGGQGSGKTISIVKMLLEDYANGKKIMTNFTLQGIKYKIMTKEMIKNYSSNQEQIQNTSLGLTELHTIIDSRSSGKNKTLTWFFLQLRKRGVTLYGDSQHFGQIDKRVREETDIFIECQCYLLDDNYKLIPTFKKEFTDEEFNNLYIKNKCFVKHIIHGVEVFRIKSYYFRAKDISKYYNTNEVIDINN